MFHKNMFSRKKMIKIILILFISLFFCTSVINAAPKLKGYSAAKDMTSVSGLSSGGFMATQFHVAYSKILMGVGVVAGGPYYCSGCNNLVPYVINAQTICMQPVGAGPNPNILLDEAKDFQEAGWIDKLENLTNDRVYIFTGTKDSVVKQKVVRQTMEFYRLVGVPSSSIKFVSDVPAGHAFITNNSVDNKCSANKSPYINNCNLKQATDILTHIYGELNPPATKLSSVLKEFDQNDFITNNISSMNSYGFIYVPRDCEKGGCRIHMALHGCKQGAQTLGKLYAASTGYNEVADTNRIIVIYPQANSSFIMPLNPEGCWDFWGYSSFNQLDPDFYKKGAVQMNAFYKMIKRLQNKLRKKN